MKTDESIQIDPFLQENETPLARKYYKLYLDMPREKRSLSELSRHEVDGKKRSKAQCGKWSKKYNWQDRVKRDDVQADMAAYETLMEKREKKIQNYIETDIEFSIKVQMLCKAKLDALEAAGETMNCKELRQIVLTYKECREWLKNLLGILEVIGENNEEKNKKRFLGNSLS